MSQFTAFPVQGDTHQAFAHALCEHKGWRDQQEIDRARRIVKLCDEWSIRVSPHSPNARESCLKFVRQNYGISASLIFFVIRLIVSLWLEWFLSNYGACRSAQRAAAQQSQNRSN